MTSQELNIIDTFRPIALKEMDQVALMKRSDTKFILPFTHLAPLLAEIRSYYKVLEIDSQRIMTYSSLYFDTEDNQFYNDHHKGKSHRTKVRMRKYVESNLCFFEIKQKDGRGNTHKSRIPIEDFETNLSHKSNDFVASITHKKYDLSPSIWNSFNRITLVNSESPERVTIDLNLNFEIDGRSKSYAQLVVIEVKQPRVTRNSPIIRSLRKAGHSPYSISKYCIGMISLYENLKYNLFKKKLIRINKLQA